VAAVDITTQPKQGRQAGRANEQAMYWDHRPILYR